MHPRGRARAGSWFGLPPRAVRAMGRPIRRRRRRGAIVQTYGKLQGDVGAMGTRTRRRRTPTRADLGAVHGGLARVRARTSAPAAGRTGPPHPRVDGAAGPGPALARPSSRPRAARRRASLVAKTQTSRRRPRLMGRPSCLRGKSKFRLHLRDGVAIPRHRRDVVPVTVSARWRGGRHAITKVHAIFLTGEIPRRPAL